MKDRNSGGLMLLHCLSPLYLRRGEIQIQLPPASDRETQVLTLHQSLVFAESSPIAQRIAKPTYPGQAAVFSSEPLSPLCFSVELLLQGLLENQS